MFYPLIKHRFFDQSERAQGPIYILNEARRNRYIFLPSMLVKRSLHFWGLIESLS